jgi:TIR domain
MHFLQADFRPAMLASDLKYKRCGLQRLRTQIADMSSIFLAHSSKDKHFVRRLANALQGRGFRVWLDTGELQVGDSLFEKIGDAIRDMEFLGVVLSPNSAKSSWVQREVEVALQHEIASNRTKVLPILYKSCTVPAFLQSRLWADFTKRGSFDGGVRTLATRLASSLSLGVIVLEAWQQKAVRMGLKIGVLKVTPSGPAFTEKFIGALKQWMAERPEKFTLNVVRAALDTTRLKITMEDLVEFGNHAKGQLILYVLGIAIRAGVINEKNGGLELDEALRMEAVDHFAQNNYRTYKAFKNDAKTLFRDIATARLALRVPDSVAFSPAIGDMALVIFDYNYQLHVLWEGVFKSK